jgi:hypothetical protein
MSKLLYFIPGRQTANENTLADAGLAELFENTPHNVPRGTETGPTKQGGVVVAANGTGKGRVGYFPDDQEWKEVNDGKYWIGVFSDDSVTPDDLARTEQINGHLVKFQDGNEWLIPAARCFPEGTKLPQSLILGPNGELVEEILPRYAQMSAKAEKVWEMYLKESAMLAAGTVPEGYQIMSRREQWDIAIEGLTINYCINEHGVSILKLFTTHILEDIFRALVDLPTLDEMVADHEAALKKKAKIDTGDGSSLKNGEPDDSIHTTQQLQTMKSAVAEEG